MVCILSQDRRSIINVETVKRIFVDQDTIYTLSLDDDVFAIGTYKKPENVLSIMQYIGFSMASAKDGNKTIIIPSENAVPSGKEIADRIEKAAREKKEQSEKPEAELTPEFKAILERWKGGDTE